jgi:hypothetical protein
VPGSTSFDSNRTLERWFAGPWSFGKFP